MKVIDLTQPIFEGMGFNNCYPQESSFKVEPIMGRLVCYTMFCEPGTRLALPGTFNQETETDLEKLDLKEIYMRDAVIVDIPKKIGEKVTPEEVEKACAKADFHERDALIIRTGWGDVKRLEQLGDDYQWKTPNYPDTACAKIVEIMKAKKSNLFGYDTASISDYADIKPGWEALGRPKNWPSKEAKDYIIKVVENRRKNPPPPEGRGVGRFLVARIRLLGGLVLVSVKKQRVKIIALPLRIRGNYLAPCRALAIEE